MLGLRGCHAQAATLSDMLRECETGVGGEDAVICVADPFLGGASAPNLLAWNKNLKDAADDAVGSCEATAASMTNLIQHASPESVAVVCAAQSILLTVNDGGCLSTVDGLNILLDDFRHAGRCPRDDFKAVVDCPAFDDFGGALAPLRAVSVPGVASCDSHARELSGMISICHDAKSTDASSPPASLGCQNLLSQDDLLAVNDAAECQITAAWLTDAIHSFAQANETDAEAAGRRCARSYKNGGANVGSGGSIDGHDTGCPQNYPMCVGFVGSVKWGRCAAVDVKCVGTVLFVEGGYCANTAKQINKMLHSALNKDGLPGCQASTTRTTTTTTPTITTPTTTNFEAGIACKNIDSSSENKIGSTLIGPPNSYVECNSYARVLNAVVRVCQSDAEAAASKQVRCTTNEQYGVDNVLTVDGRAKDCQAFVAKLQKGQAFFQGFSPVELACFGNVIIVPGNDDTVCDAAAAEVNALLDQYNAGRFTQCDAA